jgi:hypothetical protein
MPGGAPRRDQSATSCHVGEPDKAVLVEAQHHSGPQGSLLQGRFAAEVSMRPIEEFEYFGFVLQMMQPKGKVKLIGH